MLKKDGVKVVILISSIFILIMMGIMSYFSYIQYQEYRYTINEYIAGITQKVVEESPEKETEWINSLQDLSEEQIEKGKSLLENYGYKEETAFFSKIEKQMVKNKTLGILTVGTLGVCFLLLFLSYIGIKDKKIEEIIQYLKKIQQKNYSLEIKDNSEGELSLLRNEIYKITVMLQEQTENLQKEKKGLSDSLSDISHQLKTPLTSMSVMLDILKEDKKIPEEKRQEFLFEMTKQLEWMNWLVISLLKLSKLDAGVVEFKQEKVFVKAIVEEVVKKLSIPIEVKNQMIHAIGEENVSFQGDFYWTTEALSNIVKNCIEHNAEGKKVDIVWKENVLYTEIQIQDEGMGIDTKDLPHIFERFYKGKNASKDSVGIGLALAKSIIEKQSGDIMVKSKLGDGSKFNIKFYKKKII